MELFKDNIKSKDYIISVRLNDVKIDVYIDDYGQQYYYKYVMPDGTKGEEGCGAYNTMFLDQIIYRFDKAHYEEYDYDKLYKLFIDLILED